MSTPRTRCASITAIQSSRSSRTFRSGDHSSAIAWLAYRVARTSGGMGATHPLSPVAVPIDDNAAGGSRQVRSPVGLHQGVLPPHDREPGEVGVVAHDGEPVAHGD